MATFRRAAQSLAILLVVAAPAAAQSLNPDPPSSPVRLVFIHHSTGQNWLSDWDGELGLALRDSNYFVSDTNYGWGPADADAGGTIGDHTDIGHWYSWFSGPHRSTYLAALYAESGMNSDYSHLSTNPGGENRVVLFKSCFPNSALGGSPSDPVPPIGSNPLRGQDSSSEAMTVANAKGIYNELLAYFATRTDKLFVVVTAPPLVAGATDAAQAANARAFNDWLVTDWLDGYAHRNVVVFDFFDVLTSNGGSTRTNAPNVNDLGWADGNHHRYRDGAIEHLQTVGFNYSAYGSSSSDSHPSTAGNLKATGEFVGFLNVAYHCWVGDGGCPGAPLAPTIASFTASSLLVNPGGSATLSWSTSGATTVTLDGAAVAPAGSVSKKVTATTTYTLVATNAAGSASRSLTVQVNDGTAGLATPTVTAPGSGQTLVVTGVTFLWTEVGSATGYDLRVFDGGTGATVFSGSLVGGGSTSTLLTLGAGSYRFAVRGCSGGFSAAQCGKYGTVAFAVTPAGPDGAPTVTAPTQGAVLTTSTQTLAWTAVSPNPALPGMMYEVLLRDLSAGTTALQITVPSPALSTVFTMRSSSQYELKVRACQAGCGPWSDEVTFAVSLAAVPTGAVSGPTCAVTGDNNLTCSWGAVANADAYQVQVVQPPPAGPGGGALTVAARQVSGTSVALPVPTGSATVFVAACNGDGCGPYATAGIAAAGENPSQPNLGSPMGGTVVSGPAVFFSWNRVPGDTGASTWYRLYVQDLSRQSAALDVYTRDNFYSAYLKAEGARYDALVVSNPGLANEAVGPAQGFNVSGTSAAAPTMVSPAHNSTVPSGNLQLAWSPVPGATLYEYFVAVLGQPSATVRGVTPGLLAQVPLTGSSGGTVYSGIVRACPAGEACAAGSDAGWGPWSNAGGPGVTNFTVLP